MEEEEYSQYSQEPSQYPQENNPLWRKHDNKAQKNGTHRAIYWVKKKPRQEDGTIKGEKWNTATKYIGDWGDNIKEGYGIQVYQNGDKYEGMWSGNRRTGQGTFWKNEHGKLKREYTGDWFNGVKQGRGTYFFQNNDRYDGNWMNDLQEGDGRMIYANGDIYEGQWHRGKRNGYGVLTKRNGDHYEGQWINDKREGQGSYYFSQKAKLFVGEWVNDQPKCGVYTEVEDEELLAKIPKKKYFTDPYFMPNIPQLELANPTAILEEVMEKTKKERAAYRAQFIPIQDMFTIQELNDLKRAFDSVAQGEATVNLLSLKTLFGEMDIYPPDDVIENLIKTCGPDEEEITEVNFEIFVRAVALLLEENIGKSLVEEEEDEEDKEYSTDQQEANANQYFKKNLS